MTSRAFIFVLCMAVVTLPLAGCGSAESPDAAQQERSGHEQEHDHGHDHDQNHSHGHNHSHSDSGPHQGHLIELGDESYHLEWTHDDSSKTLTFYVLDSTAKEDIEIPAENIDIHVSVADATTKYEVPAVREEGGTQTAKFEITDPDLFALLEDAKVKVIAEVQIDGNPYQGPMEHHHHGHTH